MAGLGAAENLMAVLDNKLHRIIARLHVRHLALEAVIAHDGRREDDCDVLGRHQIRRHLRDHARQVKDQELQDVAVDLRQCVEGLSQMTAAFLFILNSYDSLATLWN